MKGKLEAQVKKECREWLRSCGFYIFSPVQMGYGESGVDDHNCIWGRYVAIEYKRPEGGKLTARQDRCLKSVRAAGGEAWVITSLEQLKQAVKEMFVR